MELFARYGQRSVANDAVLRRAQTSMTPTAAGRSLNSPHSSNLSTPSSVTLRRGAQIDATARRAMNNHNRHSAREKPPPSSLATRGTKKGATPQSTSDSGSEASPVRSCTRIYLVYIRTVHLRSKVTARSPGQQRARILRSPVSLLQLLSPCLVPPCGLAAPRDARIRNAAIQRVRFYPVRSTRAYVTWLAARRWEVKRDNPVPA